MGNTTSPLRQFVNSNNAAGVRRILEDAGHGSPEVINEDSTSDCIWNSCVRNPNTPLHSALSAQQMDIVEILLQYGGDANAPSKHYCQTCVHQAARQNNETAARMLVKYGGDVHETDTEGRIPLHCAAASVNGMMTENADCVRYLVDVGKPGDVNVPDGYGNTPLHCAAAAGHLKALEYLAGKGGDFKLTNDNGQTAQDMAKPYFKPQIDRIQGT